MPSPPSILKWSHLSRAEDEEKCRQEDHLYSTPERHPSASRLLEQNREDNKENRGASPAQSTVVIQWSHFGQKKDLYFSGEDLNSAADLFAVLMRKIYAERPEFSAGLSYRDYTGRERLINSDAELRSALAQHNNRLSIHTTLLGQQKQFLSAEEMLGGAHRHRSLSLSEADVAKNQQQISSAKGTQLVTKRKYPETVPTYCRVCFPRYAMYQGNPYSQTVYFGLPPANFLLSHFLSQSAYGSLWPPPNFRHTWVGPNKLLYPGGLFPVGGLRRKKGRCGW